MKTEYMQFAYFNNYECGDGAKFEITFHKFNEVGIQTSEIVHTNLSLSCVIINLLFLRTPSSRIKDFNLSMCMCSKDVLGLKNRNNFES
jgi:hypothetical protein